MNHSLAGWLDTVTADCRRASLALTLIALLSFVPGFFALPAIDRDEARFAQATRQMVASGDYIDIRLQDQPRYKKPIGIHWLQAAFVAPFATGDGAPIWAYRLPSLIGAVVAVLLTYWAALALTNKRAAFLAAALMAASLVLGVEARLAKTDAALLATIVMAQGVLARAYLASKTARAPGFAGGRSWLHPLMFWVAIAIGTLIKGPVIALFVGLTAAALALVERSASFLKALRPVAGLVLCLCLVLPWFVMIAIRSEGAFFTAALGDDGLAKISTGQEGHGAPPLTHLAWFWLVFWPGSLFVALSAREIWRRRSDAEMRFLLCWVVPAWVVFELAATKLPHYLMPVFPAIAIAAALAMTSLPSLTQSRVGRRLAQVAILAAAMLAMAAVAGAAWLALDGARPAFALLAVVALASTGIALRHALGGLASGDRMRFSAGLIGACIAFYWLFYPAAARIEMLWPAAAVGELVRGHAPCERPYLVSAGYGEPSLVFNTRTDIVLTSGADAADRLAGRDCVVAVIENGQLAAFQERAAEHGLRLDQVGLVSGINIARTRWIDITVFTLKP